MKFKLVLLLLLSISLSAQAQSSKYIEQLEKMASRILVAMDTDDEAYLDEIFDIKSLADRIIIKGKSDDLESFNTSFIASVRKRLGLSTLLIKNIAARESDYDFLRAYTDKKEGHLIFRLYGEEGINYHDFLIRKIKGQYKVVDIFIYLSGEYMSDTFKRIYLMSGKDVLKASETEGVPEIQMQDLSKLVTIRQLGKQGEYEAAKELIDGLSNEVRTEKLFRILEIQIKSNLSDEGYMEVIEDYKKDFPGDPSIDLISIDHLILAEEYAAAQTAINNLDKSLGGDPFLNMQRGIVYYYEDDLQNAELLFTRFLADYPFTFNGWSYLLAIHIESGKFKEAINTMNDMLETFEIEGKDLIEMVEEQPDYASFADSEEYKSWKEG